MPWFENSNMATAKFLIGWLKTEINTTVAMFIFFILSIMVMLSGCQ